MFERCFTRSEFLAVIASTAFFHLDFGESGSDLGEVGTGGSRQGRRIFARHALRLSHRLIGDAGSRSSRRSTAFSGAGSCESCESCEVCEFGEAGEELAGACRAWASIFSSFAMDFFLVPSESKAVAVKGVGVERRPPPPTSAVAAASHRQSRHTPWAPWAPWASIQPVQPQWLSRRLQKP